MTQLSPTSQKALRHIEKVFKAVEQVIEFIKVMLLNKFPQLIQNIATILVWIRDLVPSYVYKSIFYLAIFSILYRKLKRWIKRRNPPEQKECASQVNLQNLGAQYIVKEKAIKSVVGNARTQIDSIDFELINMDNAEKHQDFRDIVFFDLMKSYREVGDRKDSQ